MNNRAQKSIFDSLIENAQRQLDLQSPLNLAQNPSNELKLENCTEMQTNLIDNQDLLQVIEELTQQKSELFYSVSTQKLIIMSLCTCGIYFYYWFYKHWQVINERQSLDYSPFLRSILYIFYASALFSRFWNKAEEFDLKTPCSNILLTTIFYAIVIGGNLVAFLVNGLDSPSPIYALISGSVSTSMIVGVLISAQAVVENINAKSII